MASTKALMEAFLTRVKGADGQNYLVNSDKPAELAAIGVDPRTGARQPSAQDVALDRSNEIFQQLSQNNASQGQLQNDFLNITSQDDDRKARAELEQSRQAMEYDKAEAGFKIDKTKLKLDAAVAEAKSKAQSREQDYKESLPKEDELQAQRFHMGNADTLEGQAAEIMQAAKQKDYNPDGVAELDRLGATLKAIKKQKGEFSPEQYDKMMSQWAKDFESASINTLEEQKKSTADAWKEDAAEVAPGVFAYRDARGGWQIAELNKGSSGGAGTGVGVGGQMAPLSARYEEIKGDPKLYAAFEDKAIRELQNEWIRKNGSEGTPPSSYSSEDTIKKMNELISRDHAVKSGLGASQPGPANEDAGIMSPSDMGQQSSRTPLDTGGMIPDDVTQEINRRLKAIRTGDAKGDSGGPSRMSMKGGKTFLERLSKEVEKQGLGGNGSHFISPRAISVAKALGVEPIEHAARAAYLAIRDKKPDMNWNTMNEVQKGRMGMLEVPTILSKGDELAAELKQLTPGTLYFDSDLNLTEVEETADERASREAMEKAAAVRKRIETVPGSGSGYFPY